MIPKKPSQILINKYPIIYFIIAFLVVLNNIFQFASGQVLSFPLSIIIPALLSIFGYISYKEKSKF
jgi:hypothetical protein